MEDKELLRAAEEVELQAAIARVMHVATEQAVSAAADPEAVQDAVLLGEALQRVFPEETLRYAKAQARALRRQIEAEQ